MGYTAINGFWWPSFPLVSASGATTMDNTGESQAVIGQIEFQDGITASKTCSAAGGGKIALRINAVTAFANASTFVRVGLQDVDTVTTGLEDGTFDVYAEYQGGTDTLTASTWQTFTMESGSKTLALGDIVAIVIEMTARGGADSIGVRTGTVDPYINVGDGFPYGSTDVGTLAKGSAILLAAIQFDDGTVGWIRGGPPVPVVTSTSQTFNSTTSPDEYIGTFVPTVPLQIRGIGMMTGGIGAGETPDLILYSDPFGSPSAIETFSLNSILWSTGTAGFTSRQLSSVQTLTVGTAYGIALKANQNTTITTAYWDLTSGSDWLKACWTFGTNCKYAGRTDGTGAFSVVQAYYLPMFAIEVCGLSDGASSGPVAQAPLLLTRASTY